MAFKEEFARFQEKVWRLFFRILYPLCAGLLVLIAEKIIEYVARFFFPEKGFFPEGLVLLSNGTALVTFLIFLFKEICEYVRG